MTTGSIVLDVCQRHHISPDEFFGRRRHRKLVEARISAIMAFRAAGFSVRGTARMMRCNHSSVAYWLNPDARDRKRATMRRYRSSI